MESCGPPPPPPPSVVCPAPPSSGVTLYKHAGYNCGGEGNERGYFQAGGTGFHNTPGTFNDQASSIRIAPGWSVKLYQHNDTGSAVACRTVDDGDFAGDQMSTGVGLNDQVSSLQVFNNSTCGGNQPPRTPSISSPSDYYQSPEGLAPQLCWNNPGDPNGDQIGFEVDVFESGATANSGLVSGTCWRPGSLDRQYFNYQWRVRSFDGQQYSGWSAVRHFTINPPNRPPGISFNTANGNALPDGPLFTRTQNWTFAGTASDPEGQLSHVDGHQCSGDGCGSLGGGGAASWSFTRSGMTGKNDVYFVAYDNQGLNTPSRHLDLRIDLAGPTTTAHANNDANAANWPAWFRAPVQVRLEAPDNGTGGARSDTKEVHYRVDGGGWQVQGGQTAAFIVSGDGTHTVAFYAVDNVGNQEASQQNPRSISFKIDATQPTAITGTTETHGVASNVWQKNQRVPTFQWAASSDATSGLARYDFYFGTDPNGASSDFIIPANATRQLIPLPNGLRTGTYHLRGIARDVAGNTTPWSTLFTFRYDGTPPENPGQAVHAAGVKNDVWQRGTRTADFTWPAAADEGSGIGGYYVRWSTDAEASTGTLQSTIAYQSATPLCGLDAACTGYLRIRSVDNVGNLAEKWTTVFVLRYDNAPPVADFQVDGGITQTQQTLLTLAINATDQGSGVQQLRLSDDGVKWGPWEIAVASHPWSIPAISRQTWPVFLQVRDGVGLDSAAVSKSVYLDVNPKRPRSASFRLFANVAGAAGGAHTSPSYRGRSTIAQAMDSARAQSASFRLVGGYEAGSQAIPLVDPPHDEFNFINGVFASGSGAGTLQSGLFRMDASLGEIGLPNNTTAVASTGFRLQPGFLAARPSPPTRQGLLIAAAGDCNTDLRRDAGDLAALALDIFGRIEGDERGCNANADAATDAGDIACTVLMIFQGPQACSAPPPRACAFPELRINGGSAFTNITGGTIEACAPQATQIMVSRQSDFAGATWQPYDEEMPVDLGSADPYVSPRYVYAAFREADGTVRTAYFDDIIHDPVPPTGSVGVQGGSGGGALLSQAQTAAATGTAAERHILGDGDGAVEAFRADDGQVYVERVGGESLDRPLALVGAQAESGLDLVLIGLDDNSGIAEMQVSPAPDFSGAVWEPYKATKPYAPDDGDGVKTVYARYKDGAGNVSGGVETSFVYDTEPPFGGIAFDRYVVGPNVYTNTLYLGAEDNLSGVVDMRVGGDPGLSGAGWQPFTTTLTLPISVTGQSTMTLYAQYRDLAGNVSDVYSDSYDEDVDPPVLYAEVLPGIGLTRTLSISAYDIQSPITTMRLSNDPLWVEAVVTQAYTDTVQWVFDNRRAVYVQLVDAVGNVTDSYPVYAADSGSLALRSPERRAIAAPARGRSDQHVERAAVIEPRAIAAPAPARRRLPFAPGFKATWPR